MQSNDPGLFSHIAFLSQSLVSSIHSSISRNMIYTSFQHCRSFLYIGLVYCEANLFWNIENNLPLHSCPLPLNPSLQTHKKEPAVFLQVASSAQSSVPRSHSFMSVNSLKYSYIMHVKNVISRCCYI